MSPDPSLLHNDHLSLAVAALGAEMQHLRTASGDDLLWHGDPAVWSGRAPVLFPIVGRAPDDTIAVADHSAPMAQHGFARRCIFALQSRTDSMCRHVLRDDAASRAVYPFAFALTLTRRLDGPTLQVTADIENCDNRPVPFGVGFHPAFRWPLPGAQGVHQVTLEGATAPQMARLQDGLLQPDPVPGPFRDGVLDIREDLFDAGALVFPDSGITGLRYGAATGPTLEFSFDHLPDVALWRPVGAPFVCIEPWHGTASRVGDGPQIAARPNSVTLTPGATARFGYSVTVRV